MKAGFVSLALLAFACRIARGTGVVELRAWPPARHPPQLRQPKTSPDIATRALGARSPPVENHGSEDEAGGRAGWRAPRTPRSQLAVTFLQARPQALTFPCKSPSLSGAPVSSSWAGRALRVSTWGGTRPRSSRAGGGRRGPAERTAGPISQVTGGLTRLRGAGVWGRQAHPPSELLPLAICCVGVIAACIF